ncbi:MAG: succinylglutamate desuccinylase/aspartoacylase family protein [Gramella sp.]|nr:succinylglutamate desuccinylase/aspartoacylase family protein [Christiangramia sp.]
MTTEYNNIEMQDELIDSRFLKIIRNKKTEPAVIFFAGMHGNEPAGKIALQRVIDELDESRFEGSFYAISGNLQALSKNKRFIDYDLNRMWTPARINKKSFNQDLYVEDREQRELYDILHWIISTHEAPVYFIDLHTTSSKSPPFITINDSLINRRFSRLFPVPVILGIEEYLAGPLLSYINELGFVALGFESGQHTSKEAVNNAVSFIKLVLHFSGIYKPEKLDEAYSLLQNSAEDNRNFYEIIFRYDILKDEHFKMRPGFSSFEFLRKGALLATSDDKEIYLGKDATLFMPLYQKKGEDGYYLIRKIPPFFLKLSAFLRNIYADNLLSILPGVSRLDTKRSSFLIDLRIARFLAKPVFHLLGYRSREEGANHIKVSSRDRVSKTELYDKLYWYKKTLSVRKGF